MCVDLRISRPAMIHPFGGIGPMSAVRRAEPGLYAADVRARCVRGRIRRAARRGPAARDGAAGARGAREPRAPRCRGGRPGYGRRRRDPACSCRTRSSAARWERRFRHPAATASRCASSRPTPAGEPSSSSGSPRSSRRRDRASCAGATFPSTRRTSAAPPEPLLPCVRQLVVAAGGASGDDQDAFERKLYVIRRRFELEGGSRRDRPELLVAHDRVQGHAHRPAAPRLLP